MKHHLDWSAYKDAGMGDAYADIPKHGGNYAKAVAVCINSKLCETHNKQVMCPSFKVTGNENLSTGARVRMLKAALSSDNPGEVLLSPEISQAMDLCVSCKGCKRECENNVDMPLIKAEYLAQRAAVHGHSLRSKLFAHTPRWLDKQGTLKPLIKWRNKSALLAKLGKSFLGIDDKRLLAEPAAQKFMIPEGLDDAPRDVVKPEVALLVDTFARHFEPEIAEAAIQVLQAGGYGVKVIEPDKAGPEPTRAICCGRTFLAQGMIEEARYEVERLCKAILPHLEAGRIIVGLEASCVLGLRDDAKSLGLGELVENVGKQTLLFEEFLSKEIMAKRLDLPLKSNAKAQTLVHGHCHQKAVGAMKSVRRVLKTIPEHNFEMIESGCCGMAGTFGIEAEHAEISSKMANQGLLTALGENPDAIIIANGFSCRQQMKVHGDSRAKHLAVALRDLLEAI